MEVFRRGLECYNRRDVEGYLQYAHPDCEWFPAVASLVEAKSYHGHDGVRRYFEEMGGVFETLEIVGDDVRDLGDDQYAFIGQVHGRGRGSGVELDEPFAILAEIRDGLVLTIRAYLDHAPALEAIERHDRTGTRD